MELMPHEIDVIEQAAHELGKFREHIAEKHPNGLGCYISLHFVFETSVDKAVDILLAKKTSLGENIKKECDNLLKNAQLVDNLYKKNESEARIKETEILVSVRRLISRLKQIAHNARAETEQKAKRIIAALLISLLMICAFILSVWLIPFTSFTWVKNHPHSYGIQGSIICVIPCLIFGFFKPEWRKWCWRTAAIAFLVGLLSLL
jgi:hypothetical protein